MLCPVQLTTKSVCINECETHEGGQINATCGNS
jgi:hypothetical protein